MDNFKEELIALMTKHDVYFDVMMSSAGYGSVQFFPATFDDEVTTLTMPDINNMGCVIDCIE